MKNYYYILGLLETASADEIKTAYRKLTKKFHPDVNEGDKFFEDKFKEIQEAYDVLSDKTKKSIYDLNRRNELSSSNENVRSTNVHLSDFNNAMNSPQSKKKGDYRFSVSIFIIMGLLILFVFFIFISRENVNIKFKPMVSKPKAVCNCEPILTTKNTFIHYSDFSASAQANLYYDHDTLIGDIDSVEIMECEINRRFDEDIEDIKEKHTNYYRHNKIIGSTGLDYIAPSTDKSQKRLEFFNDKNQLIKTVHKINDDSETIKYFYNDLCNSNLASLILYDKRGDKIAECQIRYNDENGSTTISVFSKDYSSYGSYKEIERYEFYMDSTCRIQSVRKFYFDIYALHGRPDQGKTIFYDKKVYNSNGLEIESSYYVLKQGVENTTEKVMREFYDERDEKSDWELEKSYMYEYQYDELGNWVVRKSNSGKTIRRSIHYHKSL